MIKIYEILDENAKKKFEFRKIFLSAIILILITVKGVSGKDIMVDENYDVEYINPYFGFYVDATENFSLSEVIDKNDFKKYDPYLFLYTKFPDGAIWFELNINNSSGSIKQYYV